MWVGDLGRQVNPGTGACFLLFFFILRASQFLQFTCCRLIFSL